MFPADDLIILFIFPLARAECYTSDMTWVCRPILRVCSISLSPRLIYEDKGYLIIFSLVELVWVCKYTEVALGKVIAEVVLLL